MAVTPNYSWPVPVDTDYVKDGAEAIKDLGDAIDATVFGLPAGGLTLINTTTFSAVTAVQVDDCFTSTYDNYLVLLQIPTVSTTNITIRCRLVDTVTPYAGADYEYYAAGVLDSGATSNLAAYSQTSFQFTSNNSATSSALTLNLFSPKLAATTNATFNSMSRSSAWYFSYAGAGGLRTSTAYEGIQFYPSSGNFTGTLSIYGYGK